MRELVTRGLLAASVLILLGATPGGAATSKIGDFPFNNDLTNDAGSAPMLANLEAGGANTFFDAGANTCLNFPVGSGLAMTKVPRSARSTFSLDIFFAFDQTVGYRRIMSFGPNTQDRGLYVYNEVVALYPKREGTLTIGVDSLFHLVVTRSGKTGVVRVYVNGTRDISFRDRKGLYVLRNGVADFFVDDASENSSGYICDLKVYNKVITP